MVDGVLSSQPNRAAKLNLKGAIKFWPIFIGVFLLIIVLLTFQYNGANNNKIAAEQSRAGAALYKKSEFKAAIPKLEAAVKLNPQSASTQRTLAQTYEAVGKLDKAEKAYQDSLKADPDQPEVLYNLAIIYKSKGQIEPAVIELEKAISINEKFVAARLVLGDLYLQQNLESKARKQYETIIEMKPFGIDLEQVKERLEKVK